MKECPRCQSFYDGKNCKKCEEDFTYKFGLEVSRRIKREAQSVKWKQKPSSESVGVKDER